MAKRTHPQPAIARPELVAEQLLEPILRFLHQAGISEADAKRAFAGAWKKSARRGENQVEFNSLEDPQPYIDIVGLWCRHPAFLDTSGLPRDLPLRGPSGFAALVRLVAPDMHSQNALDVLVSYGNVQKSPENKFRLTKPFFHIRTDHALAFEPSVRFLLDAAGNVKGSLGIRHGKRSAQKRSQHFWRSVDSSYLPRSLTKEYLAFVKTLSLTFLQDIDDWLAEHSAKPGSKSKVARVGLGLFTIESSKE